MARVVYGYKSNISSKIEENRRHSFHRANLNMQSNIAPKCMVVTPHHLATQSAVDILRNGGTAMEAMVAAAATIAVVYPHMNSIGGDGFWLIVPPNGEPIAIEACGAAGSQATADFFKGLDKIPFKGPKAANTVAGTVGGWEEVLNYVKESGYQRTSVSKLLADAIRYAEEGFPMTKQHKMSLEKQKSSGNIFKDLANVFLPNGSIPEVGEKICQPQLANTLKSLARNGLKSFYKGEVGDKIAADMASLGLPITKEDLENYSPVRKVPLRSLHRYAELYNLPPPTQGLVSLIILGILDKLDIKGEDEGEFIHTAIEATKQGFQVRDKYITDPRFMTVDPKSLLSSSFINEMAKKITPDSASTLGKGRGPGDTVWMGVMDDKGFSVSFIQSIYFEFGSGILLPQTGIIWHNRGVAFNLEKDHILSIQPGKKPFHTLNPAAAKLSDGRIMVYGTRGGDGQPQTQAAVFHRYVVQKKDLQTAVSSPRWLYGKMTGDAEDSVKVEGRFNEEVINYLKERGHEVVVVSDYSVVVGEAGALVRHPNGMMEGAFDPRSSGSAAGF